MEIKTKDELLEQVSLAVEQIQKQFVQGGNVIKDCQETFFLCQCIDNILHHGFKEGLISWAMEPTIWPLLEKITCSKDIEEIKMLHLKTDKEKCSAWVKMAVNGNLLGSYIATIDQDHSLLSNHYYEYAFLRDPVMADTVKSLLNYGIANFDFQISISQSYLFNQSEITAKRERSTGYDVFEKATKENGYESPKAETELIASHETWSKKKKKKKKQAVKTAVIEDQDDYGEVDGTVETEKQNLDTLQHSLQENCEETVTKAENSFGSHEERNGSNDETHVSNTVESSLVKTDQSGDEIVSDVRPNTAELSTNGHVTNPVNGDQVTNPVNGDQVTSTDDQSVGLEKAGRERAVFVSNELDQYLTHNSPHNFETSSKNDDKGLDSLGRIAEIASSKQEFSANDFLLDLAEPQNIVSDDNKVKTTDRSEDHSSFNTKDNSTKLDIASTTTEDSDVTDIQHNCSHSGFGIETSNSRKFEKDTPESFGNNEETSNTSKDSKENSLNLEDSLKINEAGPTSENLGKTEEHSPRNEELLETVKSKDYVSKISRISERRGTGGSSKDRNESNDDFSEILSSGNYSYDYRVRKIENPELFSSSYGSSSALSDFTDDDRDLNFIPGIHRMSSKSFSSSFEKKITADSSVSFDENGLPVFESSHYTDYSSSLPSSIDDASSSRFTDLSNEWDMFEDLLNVEEEHFSQPDNFAGLTTGEELEMAIEHYKKMIKMKEKSKQRDDLVQKLIKLRLRLQQEKEGPPVENPKYRKILSHEFSKTEGSSGTKYFCDQCGKNIWIWHSMFTCNGCGYHSHRKCMEHIQRPCPNKNLSSVSYILDICPDTGLDAQQYRCAECRKEITFSKDDVSDARICDYTGQYFCDNCHWNDQMSIPARVLRNWDFTQHKVCRKSKQLLELMKTRPIINIQEINPMLYRYVEELREVGKLRDDILIMKKYFLTCREALESKLLIQLQKRQHFVDSAHTYSFQDLVDLNNDVLLPEVSKIHALFLAHIKADCELCRARGFICEVCQDSSDVIFAFDPHAVKCTKCSAVFHKICFKPEDCPKCHRKKKVAKLT